ncbi:MAG: Fic/DOC family protein [Terriglobia bacterium]
MISIRWRWEEQDFGFRFRSRSGKNATEYYQAAKPGEFYVVPSGLRKLEKRKFEQLASQAIAPSSPTIVVSPWQNYERDWDWIETADGICINYAGCLHRAEIDRREDEGVARAMELVVALLELSEPAPITLSLIRQVHKELMGDIYPFAGEWRMVSLHKGEGPTKWPLPPGGIQPVMDVLERDVLSRTPLTSDDDDTVFAFASEVMNELLAIHPFREGNGRAAFILGNLILMQNDLLPLEVYNQRRHQDAYYDACEAGRLRRDYEPLARLIANWEEETLARWEEANGRK